MESKEKQVVDLTVGKPSSIILKFYIPLLFTYTLQQLYNIVDSIIVGKGLGDNSLAAVGNMGSLTFLIIGACIGLANGFGIPIGQRFGAKKYGEMRRFIGASVVVAIVLSAICTTLSVLNLKSILHFMQVDPKIIDDSIRYGSVMFGGMCFALAYNLSASILRALGDSKTPFIAIITSTITNIVMDYLMIFVFDTGVIGAAAATVFSQVLSTLICLNKLRKIEIVRLKLEDMRASIKEYLELLRNGVPMAIMNSITAIGCMVVQYHVNGLGVVHTAAYSISMRYINLFMQPSFAVGNAMSAFTSQNYGAGKLDRIKNGLYSCITYAMISYVIFALIMVTMPGVLAGFMLNGKAQIDLVKQFLPRAGLMMWSVDLLFVFRMGCQGMGKALFPMISGAVEMILRIVVIVCFLDIIGFVATAYAEAAAWTGALLLNAVAFVILYNKEVKKQKSKEVNI